MENEFTTKRSRGAIPWVSGAILLLAVATRLGEATDSGSWWEWNKEAIRHGEWWRVASAHLAHWSIFHLVWDGSFFLLLAIWVERSSRQALVWLVFALGFVSFWSLWYVGEDYAFRGLSALGLGLLVFVAGEHSMAHGLRSFWLCMALLAMFCARLWLELIAGSPAFPPDAGSRLEVTLCVYAASALVGTVAVLTRVVQTENSWETQRTLETQTVIGRSVRAYEHRGKAG